MANNIAPPPADTPFFSVGGRLAEVWRLWLTSLSSGVTAVAGALLSVNNLSDVQSAATSRTNLGLGTAATHAATDFDASGAAAAVASASLQKTSNLSDLQTPATALANLGGVTSAQAAAAAPVQSVNGQVGAVSLTIPAAQVAANLASSGSTGVTGVLPVANGGTGANSAAAALANLGGASLSAANTFSASNTFNASVLGSFGGWQSWTPTVTGSGSMTVSGVSVSFAEYIRVGPLIHFELSVNFTPGGTAANTIMLSLPVTPTGSDTRACAASVANGSLYSAVGFVNPSGGNVQVQLPAGANFALTASWAKVSGTYRCA